MPIIIPAYTPAAPASVLNYGDGQTEYIFDASTPEDRTMLVIKTNMSKIPNGGVGSFVCGAHRYTAPNGTVPARTFSCYTVVKGNLGVTGYSTPAEAAVFLDRVRATLTPANLARIFQGQS